MVSRPVILFNDNLQKVAMWNAINFVPLPKQFIVITI